MIPRSLLDGYGAALDRVSDAARAGIAAAVAEIDLSDVAEARSEIVEIMDAYLEAATDAAASLSSAFYDAVRELELGERSGACGESRREPGATEESVRAFMQVIVDGGTRERLTALLLERADYEVKVAANRAVVSCGERDAIG